MTSHENYTCDEKRSFANAEMKHLVQKIYVGALYLREHIQLEEFPNLTADEVVERLNRILEFCTSLEDVRKELLSK